jgi:hypothetical protein
MLTSFPLHIWTTAVCLTPPIQRLTILRRWWCCCYHLQYFDPGAAVLTVVWIAFIFLVMFTASDRFFCPALELLSEWVLPARLQPWQSSLSYAV